MKKLLSVLMILHFFTFIKGQSIEKYYEEGFSEVLPLSNGDYASIINFINYRNEYKFQFVRFNSKGEMYYKKDLQESTYFNPVGVVTPNDELVFINSQYEDIISKFNSNGELLWTKYLYSPDWSQMIIDSENNFLISGSVGFDCNISKVDSEGELIWNKVLVDFTSVTATEFNGGYVVAGHKVNAEKTNPIGLVQYNKQGEVENVKQFEINSDISGLSVNNGKLYATTSNGLLLMLDENLDTVWTKKIAGSIDRSKGNEHGIFFYEKSKTSYLASFTSKKIDFEGNLIWQNYRSSSVPESVRDFSVTPDDSIILVCSTEVSGKRTLLLKPNKNTEVLNVKEETSSSDKLYPNPVAENSLLNINLSGGGALIIYDQNGKKVRELTLNNEAIKVEHQLTSGLYFYRFIKDNSTIATGKLVVDR
ncbi:MAG: T9SS type A sorting domain-containing protein [Sporocytophaga sp.]|uniref:T9SS type A sorting domain-containing protein n=1 Tax=Sporocytophaga sp. TaxID=2231183 RepID=UPI001B2111E4|nr:T9SS type A sorting domain-containing protein [Sporocytophaga sp.]MBO9703637.1 T9SS type A sorting domain-containing protein [Sporocytophaga sp.]